MTSTNALTAAASLDAELALTDPALLSGNALLAAVFAGSGDCIKILDLQGRLQFMSEGGKRVMEVEDFSVIKGCPWPDFWEDSGNTAARTAIEDARSGKKARFEGSARTAKGTLKFWDVQVLPIPGPDGAPAQLLSISRDITAQKDAEQQAAVIRAELHHRIKNILAMVSAIATQTLRGPGFSDQKATFNKRLIALGKAHDLLNESAWAATSVAEVVSVALEVHRTVPDRFAIFGPDVSLPPKLGLSLAMAVHELATNAVKYGALSGDGGKVVITWAVDDAFSFEWAEMGGPSVQPPVRGGFGSKLVTRVLASDFQGSVSLDYEPNGVICRLICPAKTIA